ncbi:MAG: hypothetical protein LUE23_08055, partial [Lachnospiraceae bacterium]|nr:hypothetical protein [Lachnospiraceae bacterium]
MIKSIHPVVHVEEGKFGCQYRWSEIIIVSDQLAKTPPISAVKVSALKIPPYMNLEEIGRCLCYGVKDPEMKEGILAPLSRGMSSQP